MKRILARLSGGFLWLAGLFVVAARAGAKAAR